MSSRGDNWEKYYQLGLDASKACLYIIEDDQAMALFSRKGIYEELKPTLEDVEERISTVQELLNRMLDLAHEEVNRRKKEISEAIWYKKDGTVCTEPPAYIQFS